MEELSSEMSPQDIVKVLEENDRMKRELDGTHKLKHQLVLVEKLGLERELVIVYDDIDDCCRGAKSRGEE